MSEEFEPVSFKLDMEVDDKERILLTHNILGDHTRQLIDTRDHLVRQGLIKLGWTPPKEGKND